MSSEAHESSVGFYVGILVVLLALTLATVGVAFVDLGGAFNTLLAMAVATLKASLVLWFFMHMRGGEKANIVIIVTGLFLLALMIGFIVGETGTRGWIGY